MPVAALCLSFRGEVARVIDWLIPHDHLDTETSASNRANETCLSDRAKQVSGVDVSQGAVGVARARLNGTFCAANFEHLPFVPTGAFDHAVSFAALMYAADVSAACRAAAELVRLVKPGGTVFLGQINDPDMRPFAGKGPEGTWGVAPLFWYRFAHDGGHHVRVVK